MYRTLISLGSILVLAACHHNGAGSNSPGPGDTAPPASYERISFADETATAVERSLCAAAGGDVRQDGRAGWEQCIQTPPDAGKTCSDSSECLDRCMLAGDFADYGTKTTGQCSQTDSPFGCYQTVENGVAEPALCVD